MCRIEPNPNFSPTMWTKNAEDEFEDLPSYWKELGLKSNIRKYGSYLLDYHELLTQFFVII